MTCKYNVIFCVQVKNKPCVKYTTVMRLISWIHTRGSETLIKSLRKHVHNTSEYFATCRVSKDVIFQSLVRSLGSVFT